MRKFKVAIILLGLTTVTYAYSSGPPAGVTGAPGEDGRACTVCHFLCPLNPDTRGSVTIGGVPANYLPGQRYGLTVMVTHPDLYRRRWGFQITAITQLGNQPAGAFEVTDPTITQRVIGGPDGRRQYVEHTSRGTALGTIGGMTWSFNWVAPSQDVGPVVFYAAGNAANGDGSPFGDKIFTTSTTSKAPLGMKETSPAVSLN